MFTIAIIGRPNVGKSTLFNRILGRRQAIVQDFPGVTRDRHYAECDDRGRRFQLIDTGGLMPASEDRMLGLIREQSRRAIDEADALIFLMDGREGLTPMDRAIADLLRGVNKPVFVAINKIDTPKSDPLIGDFYELGMEPLFPLSSEHGAGVAELLDALHPLIPATPEGPAAPEIPKIAVVGRPNVGKSTFINTLLGETRLVVSDVPGTTRDSIDTLVRYKKDEYLFIDTAGIRRRGKIDPGVERYSVARAMRAIGRADLAVLILDGVEGVTEQDTKIAGLALRGGRACVLLVNKWDLRADDADARAKYEAELHRRFSFLTWAPVMFGSALQFKTVTGIFALINDSLKSFAHRVPTAQLNRIFQQAIEANPLPIRKGKPVKSAYITQVAAKPPTFVLFCRHADDVGAPYLRYLENYFREKFGLGGTPIRIFAKEK
jgi:GTP-binding protein